MNILVVFTFFSGRLHGMYRSVGNDVCEIFIHASNSGIRWLMLEPNDEKIFDESHRVIVEVEADDKLDRVSGIVGDVIEVEILRRDEPIAQKMFADVFVPSAPIGAAGTVHQHQWHNAALA